jgi:hypothetical protein
MKATLTFNLPEDDDDFRMAINGSSMYNVLWEMDKWLRANTKHAPDTTSEDTYNAYLQCRNQLRELLGENEVDFK